MTSKEQALSSQIKGLLSGLSEHGAQHLTEVETDLVQTTFLLGEAIEKLGASFLAIHEAICAQQEIINTLLAATPAPKEVAEHIKAKQEEIGHHVNSAVTGLQFQDMTSQLIGRTVRRINGLREVLAAVATSTSAMTPDKAPELITKHLDDIGKLLEDRSTELESALWKSVNQTRMESGDIELF